MKSISTPKINTFFPTQVKLKNPDLKNVNGVNPLYWKCQNKQVVSMTASEITAVNNSINQKNINNALLYDIDIQDLLNTLFALKVINKAKFDAELLKQMGLQ